MVNSKLISLLDTFSKKEKDQLGLFLKSGFTAVGKHEIKLFDYLMSNPKNQLNKPNACKFVFGTADFDDQKFRLTSSRLFKIIEKYTAFKALSDNQNKALEQTLLYRYYRKHHNKKLFNNLSSNIRTNEEPISLQIQLEMEFEDYQFNSLEKRDQKLNLQKLLDLTDKNFFIKKLRFACYALSHKAVYNVDYAFGMLEEIIDAIETNQLHQDPHIGIYYYCYLMITNQENHHYNQYKNQLFKNDSIFEQEEKRSLYFFALNRCINKLNNGDKDYGLEGLEIYQKAINNRVLFINGFLSRFTYRNMAMMAIRSDNFNLAEALTKEYEIFLRKEDKANAYHFNMALINYFQKDLNEALSNIMVVKFKDQLISLAAKTLQAKIYFELDQDKILDSHLDSMEMYIIRNKLLGNYKKNYKNFIKYTKKLVRLNPYQKEAKEKLVSAIKSEAVLTEKKWLLSRLS